jgi:formate dehydrogenase gamma subunit
MPEILEALGRKHSSFGLAALVFGLLFFGPLHFAAAEEELESQHEYEEAEDADEPESCEDCHAEGIDNAPIVTLQMLGASIHEDFECQDCHEDVELGSHEEEIDPVDCSNCHEDEAEVYRKHGRFTVGVDSDIPSCSSCHGTHDILGPDDENSRVHALNLPETCGNCHENYDLTANHKFLPKHPVETYRASVHGKAPSQGRYPAAMCIDCHATEGSAHRILSPADPESSINHFAIPNTCGQCHEGIEKDYWDGIHGQLVARGEIESPVCTHCHGEHQIIEHEDPRSSVSHSKVAEATCTPCHESATLNEKYGGPAGRLTSFIDSYHGLKSMAGDATVANCASCHGAHRILPHTDESSSIHADNLQQTCGECHPGISSELAQTRIHEIEPESGRGWPEFFTTLYITLIATTLGGMLLYIGLDMWRQIRNATKGEQVQRMTKWAVFQHSVLLICFVILVITGFALRFSDAWWSLLLFGREGGFPLRNLIHRISAVVLVLLSISHLFYLRGARGREFMHHILPSVEDLVHFRQMISYNLGLSNKRPHFGRFTFGEKFEYWALIWGMIIMAGTGTMLWFDDYAVRVLPKTALDVMQVIHYYEAWLATISILVWHMYATVLNPSVYPMNPSWITGKMPIEQHRHEHPGDTEALSDHQESP